MGKRLGFTIDEEFKSNIKFGGSMKRNLGRRISTRAKLSGTVGVVTSLNKYEFSSMFMAIRPNSFSYDALEVLYDHFYADSEIMGMPYDVDVIAVCSEWFEYESIQEAYDEYSDYLDFDTVGIIDDDGTVLDEEAIIEVFTDCSTILPVGYSRCFLVKNF